MFIALTSPSIIHSAVNVKRYFKYLTLCIKLAYHTFRKQLMDTSEAGRLGGIAAGKALTQRQKTLKTRKAVKVRWERYYAANPEKLVQRQEREAKRKKRGRAA